MGARSWFDLDLLLWLLKSGPTRLCASVRRLRDHVGLNGRGYTEGEQVIHSREIVKADMRM